MGTRDIETDRGFNSCEEEPEAPQVDSRARLAAASREAPGSDNVRKYNPYLKLDALRKVASGPDRRTLFARARVPDEFLVELSQAGVLRVRGKLETNCGIQHESGELVCCHSGGEPALDCRLPSCPYAALMRMRLVMRLRAAYALERSRLAGP